MALVCLKLADGDLSINSATGALEWVTAAEAVEQLLLVRLRLFYGEWFADVEAGVPYYQQILDRAGRPPSSRLVEAALRRVILETPYVEAITAFEMALDKATRVLSVTFSCSTSEGDVDISEVFPS